MWCNNILFSVISIPRHFNLSNKVNCKKKIWQMNFSIKRLLLNINRTPKLFYPWCCFELLIPFSERVDCFVIYLRFIQDNRQGLWSPMSYLSFQGSCWAVSWFHMLWSLYCCTDISGYHNEVPLYHLIS